jgi:hypothetical protein
MAEPEQLLKITGIVAARDGQPYVQYTWGEFSAQMTPEEAVRHALLLVEAAQAALCDGFLVRFLKEKIELAPEQYAQIIQEFRNYREQRGD